MKSPICVPLLGMCNLRSFQRNLQVLLWQAECVLWKLELSILDTFGAEDATYRTDCISHLLNVNIMFFALRAHKYLFWGCGRSFHPRHPQHAARTIKPSNSSRLHRLQVKGLTASQVVRLIGLLLVFASQKMFIMSEMKWQSLLCRWERKWKTVWLGKACGI